MIFQFRQHGFGLLLVLMQTLSSAGIAWADQPARVGRLSYLSGAVSFAPAGVDRWVSATLNYPLTTGDRLWTDTGARTELHVGSTAIRMDHRTELDILNLNDNTLQLRLPQGTVSIGLQAFDESQHFEVDTPTVAVVLLRPGQYRVDVDDRDTSARVTVLGGAASVTSSSRSCPSSRPARR